MKRTPFGLGLIMMTMLTVAASAQSWTRVDASVHNPAGGAFLRQYEIRNVPTGASILFWVGYGSGVAPGVYANNLDVDPGYAAATVVSGSRWYESNSATLSTVEFLVYDPSRNIRVALYSPWGSFSTKEFWYAVVYPPGTPATVTPAGTVYTTRPTFSWSAISGVQWYYVEVLKNNYVVDHAWVQNVTTWKPTANMALGNYTWRVRAWKIVHGRTSAQRSFTVAIRKPGTPVPLAPAGNITNKRPTFSWQAASDAEWYLVWVNQGSYKYVSQWVQGGTAWRPGSDLPGGKSYRWWVCAWNADGGYGDWSAPMDFYEKLQVPGTVTLLSPAGKQTSTTLTFTWTTDPLATWYQLWLNKGGVKNYSGWTYYTGTAANVSTGLQGMEKGKSYTWWIQTWGPDGYGPWSGPLAFNIDSGLTVPAKPVLLTPVGSIQTATPQFQWQAAAGADSYILKVQKSGGSEQSYETTSTHFGTGNLFEKDVAYTWWVGAKNALGTTWSDPFVFKYEDQAAKWMITLSWGATPADLDLHGLFSGREHIYYLNKDMRNVTPFAVLDVDKQYGYGPEHLSCYSDPGQTGGKSVLIYVHNFTGKTDGTPPFNSTGMVTVTTPAGTRTFMCQNVTAKYWKICMIDSATGAITDYNTYQNTEPTW